LKRPISSDAGRRFIMTACHPDVNAAADNRRGIEPMIIARAVIQAAGFTHVTEGHRRSPVAFNAA